MLQGTLYGKGSIISRVALLVIILTSFVHLYKVIRMKKRPPLVSSLFALLIMFTIYAVILFITDGSATHGVGGRTESTIGYIKGLYISILPVFSCYYFAVTGKLNSDILRFWVFVFLFVAFSDYLEKQMERIQMLADKGVEAEEIVNNTGYFFVALIPCAMIFDKKLVHQLIILGYCIIMLVIGMKRGAILIGGILLMVYAIYYLKNATRKQKALVISLIVICIAVLVRFVGDFIANSALFASRIESTMDGNMSGRDTIYMDLIHKFWEANPFQMLFGRGAHGTIKVTFNYAHNDWLEFLTDQGLFGVIMYLIYWFSFLRVVTNKKLDERSRVTMFMLFIMLGMKTLFSMSIGDMNIYSSCMYGYALADGFARDKNKYIDVKKARISRHGNNAEIYRQD